jgi:hypothetical protein
MHLTIDDVFLPLSAYRTFNPGCSWNPELALRSVFTAPQKVATLLSSGTATRSPRARGIAFLSPYELLHPS